jgi:uncharacterized protein YjbJ (UPF0337 family)
MNKEQREGRLDNLRGRLKQGWGSASGDKAKEAEGATERASGSLKKAFGDLKQRLAKKLEH